MKIELSHVIDLIFEDLQDVRDMTDDAVQSLATCRGEWALNNVQGALGAIAGLSAKLAALTA